MCHKFMAHPLFFISSKFFSSDFTDESEAFLLIGLLTDFRGYLASGQWLAPEIFPYCFCHADFADDADFSSWKFFVPQISQIYTDFLWNLWWISLSVSGRICNDRTGRIRENPWVIALAGNLRINSVSSDEKSVYICEICGTFSNLRGYL